MKTDDNWKKILSSVREEEWEEAIRGVDSLIKKEPADPGHFIKLGDLYLNEGNTYDAVIAYREAIGLYRKDRFYGKAILLCKKILEIEPENSLVKEELSDLLKEHRAAGVLDITVAAPVSKVERPGPPRAAEKLRAFLCSGKAPVFLKELLNSESVGIVNDLGSGIFLQGQEIIREGEMGESMFIILGGLVEVSCMIQGKKVALARLGEGDIFGEMAFLTAKPRSATVTALSKVEAVELDKALLDLLIGPRPQLLKHMYNIYTSRIDETLRRLKKPGERLSGQLDELPLADLLQVFDQSKKEGTVFISAGGESGSISFGSGMIMDADFAEFQGEDALVRLLSLKDGMFRYEPGKVPPGGVSKPVHFVLMESVRLTDEMAALRQYLPEGMTRLQLSEKRGCGDADEEAVVEAFHSGAATLGKIREISGLSRIRTDLAAAKLLKKGVIRKADL